MSRKDSLEREELAIRCLVNWTSFAALFFIPLSGGGQEGSILFSVAAATATTATPAAVVKKITRRVSIAAPPVVHELGRRIRSSVASIIVPDYVPMEIVDENETQHTKVFNSKPQTYSTTEDEVEGIEDHINSQFPDAYPPLQSSYVKKVLSQPDSKNKSERRTVDYATKKLMIYSAWREEFEVTKLVNDGLSDEEMKKEWCENAGRPVIYWKGVDAKGRPIMCKKLR
jgi:hypothetical protein